LNEREVEIFLDAVLAMAEPVKVHFLWRPQLRDPGDEMVLETAVNGQTDALVTFNVRDCKEDRTRINQLVATAVTEKLSALQTAEFFADRK
jgi:predicted nucleic acid-binding protein